MFRPLQFRMPTIIALIVCISAPTIAGETVSMKGSFKGNYTTVLEQVSPPVFSATGTAYGTINHFGKASVTVSLVTTQDSSGLWVPVPNSSFGTLTAANGDQIIGIYHWHTAPAGPTVISIFGTFTASSGTGRFAGANGQGTFTGSIDILTGDFSGSLDGDITSVGSSH